ncbi:MULTISPECIES: NlpC/P60 family protein [unclassified Streptomyces]|uniref:C40 family peptidase n=1 Tax=unclassified Streptomyces TaxID=2593676 RepID=UPI002237B62F|nr:C40 family peptidase [Streptomyces sp. SHP 1-2]MCW5249258.1 C40 family peptidase [Streptomyces sp. SHP 1-2]
MGSHRRLAPSGPDRGAVAAVGLLSAAAAVLAAVPAAAAPHDDSRRDRRAEVDRLYTEAERATEAYNRAGERTRALRTEIGTAQDRIARDQERVNTLRDGLGSLAGAQYRSGGIDPSLELLLSAHPDDYLDRASVLDRIEGRSAGRLTELRGALRELAQERAEAARRLGELERGRRTVAAHKKTVERKLAAARRLLNSLPEDDRAGFGRASRSGRAGLAGPDGPAASGRAAAAVAAARSALGRPYVWGANGPGGFDCSGLMQWSYARAGVGLPRTSQAQRYAGRRVPLSEARPGDLVAYRDDASHIGMYVGGGRVIHAPYPGAAVRYDPVGMMPVSSVTRV